MDRSAGVTSTPSSTTFFLNIGQRALFSLIAASFTVLLLSAALPVRAQSLAQTKSPGTIQTPAQARSLGLDSLHRAVRKDKGVPLPSQLNEFVKDRKAAVQLGKALFWDMQLGSDGLMACASCHFHAGADPRTKNQFNPDRLTVVDAREDDVIGYYLTSTIADVTFQTRQPNEAVMREDFPLIKSIETYFRAPDGRVLPGNNNSNDIMASMGTLFTFFEGVRPGSPFDAGTLLTDPIWNVAGRNVRRTEPRNAPTVINAVFNFTNFWDGRANPHFNGGDAFGAQDPLASVYVDDGQGLVEEFIAIDNASLASQAMDAPVSFVEMSYGSPGQGNFRLLAEIGVKLLRSSPSGVRLAPLGLQKVHRLDSVLGSLSNAPGRGLNTSYEALIKKAFHDRYWKSTQRIPFVTPSVTDFSQMEANFTLFFGLAVALYEATLVADRTPFDLWMETGFFNPGFGKKELAGLNLFANEGKCLDCHAGPELTKASVRHAQGGKSAIKAMAMGTGTALYDSGFYNIGVTPTTDDRGRGGNDLNGYPLSFSRQSLFHRLELLPMPFPIFGNDHLPAKDEDLGSAVCTDLNGNGVCEPQDPILPAFQRVAVDGAFKTPGLRNVELTGPYFHNGGVATLRQVVQFYNRGGNFCRLNSADLDKSIVPLALTAQQEQQMVAFLVSLTDFRVKHRMAPFDHPELRVPDDGFDTTGTRHVEAVGALGSWQPLRPFLDLDPNDAIFTPVGECTPAP
jgi:cytochrome c peroxidase